MHVGPGIPRACFMLCKQVIACQEHTKGTGSTENVPSVLLERGMSCASSLKLQEGAKMAAIVQPCMLRGGAGT